MATAQLLSHVQEYAVSPARSLSGPARQEATLRILVVSATASEVSPITTALRGFSRHEVDMLATGVGMVATAARCSQALAHTRYELALNLGICGSFDPTLVPGSVVHVVKDRLVELGAEDGDAFLTARELQLLDEEAGPLQGDELVNAAPPENAALASLAVVEGITVNTVHGNERSIAAVSRRFSPHVESMEGAAFMYACLLGQVPFAQVRAVSNMVEKRNRAAWRISDAIANLGRTALTILETL